MCDAAGTFARKASGLSAHAAGLMLAVRRREPIRERMHNGSAMRETELAEWFGVSDRTIRRNLDALAEVGGLDKVVGGATLPADPTPRADEPGFGVKVAQQTAERSAIAGCAAA